MNRNKGKGEMVREKIVLFVYGIYTLIMAAAALIMHWQNWVAPLLLSGMAACFVMHSKKFRSFYFRSIITSMMCWMNISLYLFKSANFSYGLPVVAAVVVLTAMYCISDVLHIGLVVYSVHVIYRLLFIKDVTVDMSSIRGLGTIVGICSVYVVIAVCYVLIKTQSEINAALIKNFEAISRAEQNKDDFMANMSHEIRTPVNTVCGLSEIVLRRELPDEVRAEIIDIRNSGRSLLSIVSDILDFMELNTGQMEIVSADYNITSTINDAINMIAAKAAGKGLELIVDCDAKIPSGLVGDEQKIRRAFMNILDNAIKFTREGGILVCVRARKEEYGVNLIISVRDTGIGMNAESLERLFTSYNQVDTKRNRQERGLGLGLPIAKAIVNKMGGFISVRSEYGKGTEVQLVIPQKVVIDEPIVSLAEPEKIKAMLYLDMNKYNYSAIRDGYAECIAHIIEGLGINYVHCSALSDVKRRIVKEKFSHIFVSWDEYCLDRAFFEELSARIKVVLVLDRNHKESIVGSRLLFVYKPFYVLSIAAALSGHYADSLGQSRSARFIAPDASVLVVDDNLMNLKVIEGLLRPYRINVHVAENGRQALKMLDSLRIDMVFMDHMMPEMDGIETFHELRRKPGSYCRTVPVIALTANAIGGAREMFLREGFADYITKPIELSALERVLYRFIPGTKIIKYSDMADRDAASETSSGDTGTVDIEGIDVQLGIGYCSGSLEDYTDILKIYYETGIKRIGEIRRFFDEKDWENYTILVHAVKSTSLNIGAVKLSEMAKRLEAAGKEKQEKVIVEGNGRMLEEYERVIEAIKNCPAVFPVGTDGASADELKEITDEELAERLDKLHECIESYEIDAIEQCMESLSDFCHKGVSLNELLSAVMEKINGFDFMGAGEELAKLRERSGETE